MRRGGKQRKAAGRQEGIWGDSYHKEPYHLAGSGLHFKILLELALSVRAYGQGRRGLKE